MTELGKIIEMAVETIENDLRDRRGLRQEWEAIADEEIYEEIYSVWRAAIRLAIETAASEGI